MKKVNFPFWMISVMVLILACGKMTYNKTKSGLLYKIFPSGSKDSLIKTGDIVKFSLTTKLNDSVIYSNYGRLPAYTKVSPMEQPPYNLIEILPLMKKGDSALTVQMIDTLMRKGGEFPPYAKRGDKMTIAFRIVGVFDADSLAMIDYKAETEKDRPRAMLEQKEQAEKMEAKMREEKAKELVELEKSGEVAKELQAMESYLASKKIVAQKTGKGTFVIIKQQGTGAAAEPGKYVKVKYTGRHLDTDSVFQSNTYAFQLGKGYVIEGWDEGIQMFKQGGKGTLFVPSFLAYGKNPPPNSPFKVLEPLKFDIELLNVSDTLIENTRE